MNRKIHASMLCKSTRNTLSQKSREAKRGSSENNRKQARGKKYDERKKHRQKPKKKKKNRKVATEPCDKFTVLKINSLRYFSLPFTLLEPFGAVVMNSKVH